MIICLFLQVYVELSPFLLSHSHIQYRSRIKFHFLTLITQLTLVHYFLSLERWCFLEFVCIVYVIFIFRWPVRSKQLVSLPEERLLGSSSLPRFVISNKKLHFYLCCLLMINGFIFIYKAARKSAPTTGGVKKPHRYRPGTVALRLVTMNYCL